MKKVLILILALLMLCLYGCGGDCGIPPENTEATTTVPETTETNTYHPYNTYAILRAEQERITEYMQNYMCGDLVTGTYVDDSRGALIVTMKEVNEENIKFFKENISDKDFIVFEEGGFAVFTAE